MSEMGKAADKQVSQMKYSVLMSVYAKDKPEYLFAAVNSMLTQTVPPEQFVIVIDGPVLDELLQPVYEYQRYYVDLFTIVPLEKNGGLGNALNEGLKHCRNELVARMDADDISLPERCEKELACFCEDETLDICGCNIDEFEGEPENVLTSRVVPSEYEQIKRFMRRRQAFNHPTVMFKKPAVIQAGGYLPIKRKEDFDLFSRMLAGGARAKNLGEHLYLYRVNRENYKRRKSRDNFRSALYVYWRHWKRKGCLLTDLLVICSAEVFFFILPDGMMKWFSDNFLRAKRYKQNSWIGLV